MKTVQRGLWGVRELGLELDDEVATCAPAMRRETGAGYAQAARMGEAGLELEAAHARRDGARAGSRRSAGAAR